MSKERLRWTDGRFTCFCEDRCRILLKSVGAVVAVLHLSARPSAAPARPG